MITAQDRVVGVQPRIGLTQFKNILGSYSSPAYKDNPDLSYRNITEWRVDPLFVLAIFYQESKLGLFGYGPPHKSPGNTRTLIAVNGIYEDTPRGRYAVYGNWPDGFKDLAARLADKSYVYARQGRVSIADIIPVWAPEKDNNDPASYISTVVKVMNDWGGGTSMALRPDIQWIGSPNFYQGRDNQTVHGICDHIMQGTMASTDAWFNNKDSEVSAHFGVGLDGKIHQYVALTNTAWANGILQGEPTIDWLKECRNDKGETIINPNSRTISIEHEGYTGNPMPAKQYQATLSLHRYIMGLYTGVSADRDHVIGHYQISPTAKPDCPGKGFPWDQLMKDLRTDEVIVPETLFFKETNCSLGGGFLAFWRSLDKLGENARLANLGLPITNEFSLVVDTHTRTVQLFERGGLIYEAENTGVWNVHYMTVPQLLDARKAAGL